MTILTPDEKMPPTQMTTRPTVLEHPPAPPNAQTQVFASTEDYLAFLETQVKSLETELTLVRSKGKLISQELDLFRQRRVVFWSDRFRNTFDAWNLMNKGFQQLKDNSALFCGSIQGFRLQPS